MIHDMQIMVPVDKAGDAGLRNVLKSSGIARVLRVLRSPPDQMANDHKERQEIVDEMLRSANPIQVAEVARNLWWLGRQKGHLGSKDTKLLDRARKMLASELAVAQDLDLETALTTIEAALKPEEEQSRTDVASR